MDRCGHTEATRAAEPYTAPGQGCQWGTRAALCPDLSPILWEAPAPAKPRPTPLHAQGGPLQMPDCPQAVPWPPPSHPSLAVLPCAAPVLGKPPEKPQREEMCTVSFDTQPKLLSFLSVFYPCPVHSCPGLGAARAQSMRLLGFREVPTLIFSLI